MIFSMHKRFLISLICLIIASFLFSCNNFEEVTNSSVESSSSGFVSSNEEVSSDIVSQPTENEWNLILVNSTNKIPDDFEITLGEIGIRKMDSRIVPIVQEMIADAKQDGVDLLLASSYRTVERQTELFNEQVQYFKNLGYSDTQAYNNAKEWVAIPGTSEHHTGLALDIVTPTYQVLDYGFDTTAAFKWLYKNSSDYGFILRYPKDKSDITKITYEPWHYRYVGIETAKYIMENNICLEEYIESITSKN